MNVSGIFSAVQSHALRLGLFERVNTSEPKSAPGNGLSCAMWMNSVAPARAQSGLDTTTALLVLNVRVYARMLQEPQDDIDLGILDAVDRLMAAYTGDFDLNGTIRNVDLLGAIGPGLSAQFGYLTIDNTMFRVATIVLPLIVNDLWTQAA